MSTFSFISKQNAPVPQDKIALVKQKYNFVYKGYSSKSKAALTEEQKKPVPIYDIVSGACFDEFPGYDKVRLSYAQLSSMIAFHKNT